MRAALALAALILAGCATPPAPSPLAQCVAIVAGQTTYTGDRIRAAQWCSENMP